MVALKLRWSKRSSLRKNKLLPCYTIQLAVALSAVSLVGWLNDLRMAGAFAATTNLRRCRLMVMMMYAFLSGVCVLCTIVLRVLHAI